MDYGLDLARSSLTPWYFHEQRVSSLLDGFGLLDEQAPLVVSPAGAQTRNVTRAGIRSITDWIRVSGALDLQGSISDAELQHGRPFVLFDHFFCKGISDLHNSDALQFGTISTALSGANRRRLTFRISADHLTSRSAYVQLSGRVELVAIGLIDSVDENEVRAIPCVIATLVRQLNPAAAPPLGRVSELARELGVKDPTQAIPSDPTTTNRFVRTGNKWTVCFTGKTKQIENRKGYTAIAALLDKPDTLVSVEELDKALNPGKAPAEYEFSDKQRDRVIKNIRDAMEPLEREFPELHQHLLSSIRTAAECSYRPKESTSWVVDFS